MTKRLKALRISRDIMLDMIAGRTFILGIPWSSNIHEVHSDHLSNGFVLIIQNDSFAEVKEGTEMPFMTNECYTTGRKGPADLVAEQSQDNELWGPTDGLSTLLQAALLELHKSIERPNEVKIHILNGGVPLCRFTHDEPSAWPAGHKWVPYHKITFEHDSDCEECIVWARKI